MIWIFMEGEGDGIECRLLKSFLLYCLIYIVWVSWTRRFARVTIQNTDCVRGSWRDSPFEKIEATKSHRRTPPALHTLTKMNGNQTTHFSLLGIEHNRDKPTEISITNFAFGYIDVIFRKGHKNWSEILGVAMLVVFTYLFWKSTENLLQKII